MASTIECIIAQRLVRKVCEDCKIEDQVDPHLLEHIQHLVGLIHADEPFDRNLLKEMKFYKGKGCDKCDGVGYTGRLGLFEVMKMNNELRKAILRRANSLEIEEIAMRTGMITLEQAGIIKALQGETSLDEVYRVARKMEDQSEAKPSSMERAAPAASGAKPQSPNPQVQIKQTAQIPPTPQTKQNETS
jgi:type IV pilus assembly protein PilB